MCHVSICPMKIAILGTSDHFQTHPTPKSTRNMTTHHRSAACLTFVSQKANFTTSDLHFQLFALSTSWHKLMSWSNQSHPRDGTSQFETSNQSFNSILGHLGRGILGHLGTSWDILGHLGTGRMKPLKSRTERNTCQTLCKCVKSCLEVTWQHRCSQSQNWVSPKKWFILNSLGGSSNGGSASPWLKLY